MPGGIKWPIAANTRSQIPAGRSGSAQWALDHPRLSVLGPYFLLGTSIWNSRCWLGVKCEFFSSTLDFTAYIAIG